MQDPSVFLAVMGTFLIAGIVKGAIGLGLPEAMAILLVPSLVTNLWQAASGGNGRAIVRRIWPFLLMATLTVWLGSALLTRLDLAWLSALLGVLLIVYAGLNLAGLKLAVTVGQEAWVEPLAGTANGILTGLTGSGSHVQRDEADADAEKPSGAAKSAVAGAGQTEGGWEEF